MRGRTAKPFHTMNGSPNVRTRKQAAEAAKRDTPNKPATMNGHANGSAKPRSSMSTPEPTENIFLFYPNIIGSQPTDAVSTTSGSHHLQATPASFSLSPLSTTCPSTPAPAPSSTAYLAFSTPSTASLRAITSKVRNSAPC